MSVAGQNNRLWYEAGAAKQSRLSRSPSPTETLIGPFAVNLSHQFNLFRANNTSFRTEIACPGKKSV